jgi:hypothetical protein
MPETPTRHRARSFRAQREFGLLVGAVMAGLGGWWVHREKFAAVRPWFLGVGLALIVLGAVAPRLLAGPYRAWMGLAEALSKVVTTLVLAIVFFLIVTPIGVFKRLTGWDPLERRAPRRASYWKPYDARQHDPKHFEKMY